MAVLAPWRLTLTMFPHQPQAWAPPGPCAHQSSRGLKGWWGREARPVPAHRRCPEDFTCEVDGVTLGSAELSNLGSGCVTPLFLLSVEKWS